MNLVYLTVGILLVIGVIVDILWTTTWVEGGAGPLTARLMELIWRAIRQVGSQNSRVLTLSGPVILSVSILLWIGLLWGGWTLIFLSAENALIDTLNRGPVSWLDHVYFTGYTIFTLGTGDFVPQTGVWQVATILATASGLLFVTLIVTYVLSVLGAVTQKRSLASSVSGLGTQSEEIVRTSWNGNEFEGLDVPLTTIASQLSTLTSNHKAYPILHYFHSHQAAQAPVVSITILDEALTLLRFGVPEEDRPSATIIKNVRSSVEDYLETLNQTFVQPADHTPPSPSLQYLRDAGIPTLSDEEFDSSVEDLSQRRRTLLGLIEGDRRQWPPLEE